MPVFTSPPSPSGRSAAWRLQPGQALSLRASHCGVLRVAVGSLWATADGPHRGAGNDGGDRVFQAGERVAVPAGRRIVIEAIGGEARFEWDPASARPSGHRVPA